jgi:predicted metal-dependent phosphoesterase TrpH
LILRQAPGLRLDLHNHTRFSSDGLMSPATLLETARVKGIGCIAVTDHNTVEGALEAVALSDADLFLPRVIPGIELSTLDGEIVGLYVWDDIRPGLPLVEAVELIRGLGGLVYLPHPYDVLRRGTISRRARSRAAELSDVIEVANGRSLGPRAGDKASRLAGFLGKPGGAGSDAHREAEVGLAWVEVEAYPTRDTLVSLVAAGRVVHDLNLWEYTLNWGAKGLTPVTRMRRRVRDDLPRR